jgi:N-acyl-D-amino-acid deacylase
LAFDSVISGALVYPGEGDPIHADVGIAAGKISAVEPSLAGSEASEWIQADGLMLCPGFIDMHAHSALKPFEDPLLLPKIAQGFTTEVINPDGLAPAPVATERREQRRIYLRGLEGPGPESWPWATFDEYLEALDQAQPTTTLVPSIGHNAVRDLVMGGERRAPSSDELQRMCREVRAGLEAGARTLSFGLIYLPGTYSDTSELLALAREAARYGAPLVPHVRNESGGVIEAIKEMIDVARTSGAPLHISHLKSRADEDLIGPMLDVLDNASTQIDLSFDQYPYGNGSTVLAALLPSWAQEGGPAGTLARLRAEHDRLQIAQDIERGLPGWENIYGTLGPERLSIVNAAPARAATIGMTLADIATETNVDPITAVFDLLIDCDLDVTMMTSYATAEAVRTIARHRLQLIGTDAIFGARPHPRLYGTTARFLGDFVLEERLLPVEEAVARLTARPARRLGLNDRGEITAGKRADLVLIDPSRFRDKATYNDPMTSPPGVITVWINGEPVFQKGEATGRRPGGVIRSPLPIAA